MEENKKTWNGLAMNIAGKLKAAERAKNIAIIVLGVIVIAMAVINYRNDVEWRELISSYDIVMQENGK